MLTVADQGRGMPPGLRDAVNSSDALVGVGLAGYLQNKTPSPEDEGPRLTLSAREQEIIQLLAEGKNNKAVAKVLHLSVKIVETHRAKIMRKLRLHSIGDLVRISSVHSRGAIILSRNPDQPRNFGGA